MIFLSIDTNDLANEITSEYGASAFVLEPGWYTLTIADIAQPYSKGDGIYTGNITFSDVDSGVSFRLPVTYQVNEDKDGWRVKKTKDLFVRLCQVTNQSDWKQLIGKRIYAEVETKDIKKNTGEFDSVGFPIQKDFKTNDFKKGPLNKIILPAK